jgi:hypothetical protein
MKKCSNSLVVKEVQIKTPPRFHLTPFKMAISRAKTTNAGKDAVKQERLYTVGGKAN